MCWIIPSMMYLSSLTPARAWRTSFIWTLLTLALLQDVRRTLCTAAFLSTHWSFLLLTSYTYTAILVFCCFFKHLKIVLIVIDMGKKSFLVIQKTVQCYINAFRSLFWSLFSWNTVRPLNFKLSLQSPNIQLQKPQKKWQAILLLSAFDSRRNQI